MYIHNIKNVNKFSHPVPVPIDVGTVGNACLDEDLVALCGGIIQSFRRALLSKNGPLINPQQRR